MVANMGKITGGIEAVPGADPKSGTLQVGIIQASDIMSWLSLIFHSLKGNINSSPKYELFQGKHIVIQSLQGAKHFECDGDLFDKVKKLEVDVYPKSLQIITP